MISAFSPLTALVALIIVQNISVCSGFSYPKSLSTLSRSRHQHHHVVHPFRQRSGHGINANQNQLSVNHADSRTKATASSSSLAMGLFDFIQEKFLDSREGDFVPLEQSDDDIFGPGPLVLMYAVPESMDDDELNDMVEDGMPQRAKEGVVLRRLSRMDENGEGGDELLDFTVGEALEKAMDTQSSSSSGGLTLTKPTVVSVSSPDRDPCPVLYFSGVSNTEMMDTYKIIANEIYEETNGVHWPACAKVVPPAMGKSMRRVLAEISGDHADAMKMRKEEAGKTDVGAEK